MSSKKEQKITIDGTTGKVYLGEIRNTSSKITKELTELLQWANNEKNIEILWQCR